MSDQNDSNIRLFEQELRSTGRKGIEELIGLLRQGDFYQAECYGHDHYLGGTLQHSLWTLAVARDELQRNPRRYPGVADDGSLIIVCLLHDLGDSSQPFPEYTGHGKRSASILDCVIREQGLDIPDLELSAIRFHQKHHIRDDLDRRLDAYSRSSLIRLLKHSDWSAAGIIEGVPFGFSKRDFPDLCRYPAELEALYVPSVHYWYVDECRYPHSVIPTRLGNVAPSSLTRRQKVTRILGANLYHSQSYDLWFVRDENGGLGVMTAVDTSMGFGGLFRTDEHAFGYRKAVLYYNRYADHAPRHYVLVEDGQGDWAVLEISLSKDPGEYLHRRQATDKKKKQIITLRTRSEDELLDALRHRHHGIELRNEAFFVRVEV